MKELLLSVLTGFAIASVVILFFLFICLLTGSSLQEEPLSVIAPMLAVVVGAITGFVTHLNLQ